jgi:hypothetical protein
MCSPQRSQVVLRCVVGGIVRGYHGRIICIRQSKTILARPARYGGPQQSYEVESKVSPSARTSATVACRDTKGNPRYTVVRAMVVKRKNL